MLYNFPIVIILAYSLNALLVAAMAAYVFVAIAAAIAVFIVVYISGMNTKWFIDNFSSHCCPAANTHNRQGFFVAFV